MKTIPVATFNTLQSAQGLKERLLQAGFKVSINDESKVERFWFFSEPLAAIHVEVDQSDYLPVRTLIHELGPADDIMREAVCCPDCGSFRVEFPQVAREFLMPMVEALLMVLHIIPRKFYCWDCHYTWPKTKPVELERDILGWPLESKLWHPERFQKDMKPRSVGGRS